MIFYENEPQISADLRRFLFSQALEEIGFIRLKRALLHGLSLPWLPCRAPYALEGQQILAPRKTQRALASWGAARGNWLDLTPG